MQLQNSARYFYVCIFTSDVILPTAGWPGWVDSCDWLL